MGDNFHFDIVPDIELARKLKCWCLLVIGARKRGKTYSMLKKGIVDKEQLIFVKRNVEDVKMLVAGSSLKHRDNYNVDDDLSPYADLNIDLGTNVQPVKIYDGVASFHNFVDGKAVQKLGFCFALASVAKYKGFGGLRQCKYIVWDEFIPAPWERVSKYDGEACMDLYITASRAREEHGEEPMLLIGLANANDLSNQLFNILEITSDVADMENSGEEYRKIGGKLIHLVDDSKLGIAAAEKETLIYQDMQNTTWGKVTFNNSFARNDISSVGPVSLKGYKPVFTVRYKNNVWYGYFKDGFFYCCTSKHNADVPYYDLNLERDRRPFYLRECVCFIDAYHRNMAKFQKYEMYDIIIHFKKYFNISG